MMLSILSISLLFIVELRSTTALSNGGASSSDWDFKVFCCGVYGGGYESSLTSFHLSESSDPYNFLSMDGGTSVDCLRQGTKNISIIFVYNYIQFV